MNRAPPAAGPRDDAERLAWLRLARTPGIGPTGFFRLVGRFGSALAALAALPDLARSTGRKLTPPTPAQAEAERARIAAIGTRLLLHGEPDYPPLLATIADPPPLLIAAGDPALARRRTVAIVGARNASAAGRRLAEDLAAALGAAGCVVVSGLARGIDAAAHRGALATGTIAAVAGGVDFPYPPENVALQAEIGRNGLVLAELPPGTQPKANHFPRRNRVIAGAALGVVVIEAAAGSGSLITARFALDEGREVFAVPGSPLDPRARGGNALIKQGAALVEEAADILAALPDTVPVRPAAPLRERNPDLFAAIGPAAGPRLPPSHETADDPRAQVIELLSETPVAVDELVRRCHLSPAQLAAVLVDLELEGRIERHPGSRVSLA